MAASSSPSPRSSDCGCHYQSVLRAVGWASSLPSTVQPAWTVRWWCVWRPIVVLYFLRPAFTNRGKRTQRDERIRRCGVTDEVFSFVLGNGSSHFLAWVQVPHWRGQRKKIGEFGEGKRAIAGLASLADIFPIWPRFLPFPHHYGAWSQATQFFFVFYFLWEFCSPPSLVVIWVVPYFICIRSVWGWGSHRLQSWRFVASV